MGQNHQPVLSSPVLRFISFQHHLHSKVATKLTTAPTRAYRAVCCKPWVSATAIILATIPPPKPSIPGLSCMSLLLIPLSWPLGSRPQVPFPQPVYILPHLPRLRAAQLVQQ